MSEPGKVVKGAGAFATNTVRVNGKSINSIEEQRKHLEDRMRDAYYDAERIDSNSERRAELARLNSRMRRINNLATIYSNNIMETPESMEGLQNLGWAIRVGENRQTRKAIIDSIRNRRYPKSVYAKRNNR